MQSNKEELFHFGGEGGGITIFRSKTDTGIIYIYDHSECYLDDAEDLQITNITKEYSTFEEAFKEINNNYPWFSMVIEVNEEFKEYVLDQIQFNPNMANKSKNEINAAIERAREKMEELENLLDMLDED